MLVAFKADGDIDDTHPDVSFPELATRAPCTTQICGGKMLMQQERLWYCDWTIASQGTPVVILLHCQAVVPPHCNLQKGANRC